MPFYKTIAKSANSTCEMPAGLLCKSGSMLVRDDTCSPPCPHKSASAPILLYNVYRVSLPGVKGPGRGVDHPPPFSAEVKERVEL